MFSNAPSATCPQFVTSIAEIKSKLLTTFFEPFFPHLQPSPSPFVAVLVPIVVGIRSDVMLIKPRPTCPISCFPTSGSLIPLSYLSHISCAVEPPPELLFPLLPAAGGGGNPPAAGTGALASPTARGILSFLPVYRPPFSCLLPAPLAWSHSPHPVWWRLSPSPPLRVPLGSPIPSQPSPEAKFIDIPSSFVLLSL